jgi:hypothetical protein
MNTIDPRTISSLEYLNTYIDKDLMVYYWNDFVVGRLAIPRDGIIYDNTEEGLEDFFENHHDFTLGEMLKDVAYLVSHGSYDNSDSYFVVDNEKGSLTTLESKVELIAFMTTLVQPDKFSNYCILREERENADLGGQQ